ncbi:MAG: DNA-binding protein [Candidatus Peregrinibacteria bacterium]
MDSLENIDRQNILNNPFAIERIKEEIKNIPHFVFEGKICILKRDVASFYEVEERTLERNIEKNEEELGKNGYEILTGKRLEKAKTVFGAGTDVGTKITRLSVFDFRAFLNIGMLLQESEAAKKLRSRLLDIAIGSIREKTGGNTKYINHHDQTFLSSYIGNTEVRKKFTSALQECVPGNNIKYAHFTNRIYQNLFGESAHEYKKLLKLSERENVRNTFYREIIDVISGYEEGIAEALQKAFEKKGRMLSSEETETIFEECFESPFLRRPRETARTLMASRDKAFREILHEALQPYIEALTPEEYERFLGEEAKFVGEKTGEFLEMMKKNKDVFDRLKDR